MVTVPDTASYIRGWIQMVLAPNDLFSWNNKSNKYTEYNITDTFTWFFSAVHTTYSVHAGILKPWRSRLPWLLVVFSFYHVLPLPLSGLNWRSLFLPWGSGPPFSKMAPPFTGSVHTPLPGSGTVTIGLRKPYAKTKVGKSYTYIDVYSLQVVGDNNFYTGSNFLEYIFRIRMTNHNWPMKLNNSELNRIDDETVEQKKSNSTELSNWRTE